MPDKKKIAVIGAGPAGLIVARELLKASIDITIFEQRNCLGGTWAIKPLKNIPDVRKGFNDIHSAAYSSLRCNLPQQMMAMSSDGLSREAVYYPSHSAVLHKLQAFSDHHNLTPLIQFNQQVSGLEKIHINSQSIWRLTTSSGSEHCVDGIVFCNGRYGAPLLPDLEKFTPFSGHLEHSLTYRKPETYQDLRIAVLGSGSSAEDISRELSAHASEIFVCTRSNSRRHLKPEQGWYGQKGNIQRCADITGVEGKTLLLSDGCQLENIDVLMLCTGYQVDHHLLSAVPDSRISANGISIAPLYLNLFHPKHPELTVVGMDIGSIPFLLYQYQAKVISRYWQGKLPLPSEKQRLLSAEQLDLRESARISFAERIRRTKNRFRHLARMAQVAPPDDGYFDLLDQNNHHRWKHPETYRDITWHPEEN